MHDSSQPPPPRRLSSRRRRPPLTSWGPCTRSRWCAACTASLHPAPVRGGGWQGVRRAAEGGARRSCRQRRSRETAVHSLQLTAGAYSSSSFSSSFRPCGSEVDIAAAPLGWLHGSGELETKGATADARSMRHDGRQQAAAGSMRAHGDPCAGFPPSAEPGPPVCPIGH